MNKYKKYSDVIPIKISWYKVSKIWINDQVTKIIPCKTHVFNKYSCAAGNFLHWKSFNK